MDNLYWVSFKDDREDLDGYIKENQKHMEEKESKFIYDFDSKCMISNSKEDCKEE